MPKKTKKQKILSLQRRQKELVQGYIFNFVKTEDNQPEQNLKTAFQQPSPKIKSTDTISQNNSRLDSYDYVKKDLIKITIFTILALTVQSVLYFLIGKG